MVGSWPSLTEDDPLLFFPSSDGDDDDPSSYLLYPPGFGPVEDWLIDPMSAAADLVGLSEALSGKICLAGDSNLPLIPKEEPKDDQVPEYEVTGSLGAAGEEGSQVLEPPVTPSEVNADGGGKGEVKSESGGSSSDEDDDDDDALDDEDGSSSSSGEESSDEEDEPDLEEGEIEDLVNEKLLASSDDENGGFKGPIKSKNEIEHLPPVPPVNATLEPHHHTFAVGVVSSIVGCRVIVEGAEKHDPLIEGSILWLTLTRTPLGIVDEIFGPVKSPFYVVRFNSPTEVPATVDVGAAVSFAAEFAGHVINLPSLYKKGYDASGENDEEIDEEAEFSDDEKEAEYRRSLRQTKRGNAATAAPFAKKNEPPFNQKRMATVCSNENKPRAHLLPLQIQGPVAASSPARPFVMGPPPPQIQGLTEASPPAQPFAMGLPPPQIQGPMATPPAYAVGQLQMQSMGYGGQNFFPNLYWPAGMAAFQGMMLQNQQIQNQVFPGMLQNQQRQNQVFPGMLPNQQTQNQVFPGMLPNQQTQNQVFPGMLQNQQIQNQAFPAFRFPFPTPGAQHLPPSSVMPWQSSVSVGEQGFGQTAPPHHGGEEVRERMNSGGGNQRPLGRGGRRPFHRGGGRFRGNGRG